MVEAAQGVVPDQGTADGCGKGIEQNLGRVETQPSRWIPGAEHPLAVELAGIQPWNHGFPDPCGSRLQSDGGGWSGGLRRIEKTDFDRLGPRRAHDEVDISVSPMSTWLLDVAGLGHHARGPACVWAVGPRPARSVIRRRRPARSSVRTSCGRRQAQFPELVLGVFMR